MPSEEIPRGFLLFEENDEFVSALQYCADFDFDVLDVQINGFNIIIFFEIEEFNACIFLCVLCDFTIKQFK